MRTVLRLILAARSAKAPLLELLEDGPEGWCVDDSGYCIKHAATSIELWAASGRCFLKIYDSPIGQVEFSMLEKLVYWPLVKHILRSLQNDRRDGRLGKLDKVINDFRAANRGS